MFTVRALALVLLGLFGLSFKATALETAYVWSNHPTGSSTAPNASYMKGDRPITIARQSRGVYKVSMGSIAQSRGNAIVTTYAGAARCQIRNWGSGNVFVLCFDRSGTATDAMFQVLFTKASGSDNIVYAYAAPGMSGTLGAGRTYSHTPGSGVTLSRINPGRYRVQLGKNFGGGGNVQVSAYGNTPSYCTVDGWSGSDARVSCFDMSGNLRDSGFTILYTPKDGADRNTAYVWGDRMSDANYTPSGSYSHNRHGNVSIRRASPGRYDVTLAGAVRFGGHAQVSAYSSNAFCRTLGWSSGNVRVLCQSATNRPIDTRFSLLFHGAGMVAAGPTEVIAEAPAPAEPEVVLTGPTDIAATIEGPRLTRHRVRPWPSNRFYVIKSGGGDDDFSGNGPRSTANARVSHDDRCIHLRMDMRATETRPDHTSGLAEVRQDCIWVAPEGKRISRIYTPAVSTGSYTDHDWRMDAIVPGRGEVDGSRPLPASTPGPVQAFVMMGDTNGDMYSNDDNGNDVGPVATKPDGSIRRDDWGNLVTSHGRTSVQAVFNELDVELERTPWTPPPPEAVKEIILRSLSTPRFRPPHTSGDREFGGNGPEVTVRVRLEIRDGRRLDATVYMSGVETGGDGTAVEGTQTSTVWRAPAGWRIRDFGRNVGAGGAFSSADRARYSISYTDTDHEDDFLIVGHGEDNTIKDANRWFHEDNWPTMDADRSPILTLVAVGDQNGADAGTKTSVRVFFRDLNVFVERVDPAVARDEDLGRDVFIDVPDKDWTLQLSGGNSCGPSAGSRVLRYYGANTSYELFKLRVLNSGNAFADQSNGTPPGTLRDRMNDVVGGFRQEILPLGRRSLREDAVVRIKRLLDDGKPVIALVGWGSNHLYNVWAQHQDSDGGSLMLHYVVIRGYDENSKTFSIVDNGHARDWSYQTFLSVFDYGINPFMEVGAAGFANTKKGSIIYRN